MLRRSAPRLAVLALLALGSSCDEGVTGGEEAEELRITCSVPLTDVHRGARRGVIPGLANPPTARWGEPNTDYVRLEDRVVGVVLDGRPIAIPLNILWWHEIVNFDTDGGGAAVTHCPLTGSSLVFDRAAAGGAAFDVSGLLYENNLMMFDSVGASESLWPQMARGARCGPLDGTALPMVASVETTLDGWLELYPDTEVVTSQTGHARDYTEYPYANQDDATLDYDFIDNRFTLFPVGRGIDRRRAPKERVLGIPDAVGGVAFPFGELERLGLAGAVHGETSGGPFVVFWDPGAEGAAAYRPMANGQPLTFAGRGSSVFDDETGSEWSLSGLAVSGPLTGARLEPVTDAFVAFWFAWPVFYPEIELWTAP